MTSRAFFSLNSNTPSISSASCGWMAPPSWLCSMSMRSSSGECTVSSDTSTFCPKRRSTNSADAFRTYVNGVVIQAKASNNGERNRATCSGWLSAAARGASSPNTTCMKVAQASATAAPILTRSDASMAIGICENQCSKNTPSDPSIAHPSPSEARVMPNWLADSTRERFPVALSAKPAKRSPERTMASSRVRRLRTSANSTATKNPLSRSRTTMSNTRFGTPATYPAS